MGGSRANDTDGTPANRTASVPPVGVVGLGEIGRGLATTLLRAGAAVTVCDVRPDATAPFADRARVATSPADLATDVRVAVVAVVDDDQVRAVVDGPDGLLAGFARAADDGVAGRTANRAAGGEDAAIVVVSTVTTGTIRDLAGRAADAGVALVDCGVSGGPAAAAAGQLVCMVGGDTAAVERVQSVLDAVGTDVLHMGPLGAGLSAKLARNLVQYGSWLAAYEGQVLAEAAGIDLALLARAIRASDQRIGGAATLMFRPTVAPLRADVPTDAGLIEPMGAAARLAHKDLRAARELADALGVAVPVARLTDAYCDAIFGVGRTPSDRTAGVGQTPSGAMPGSPS
jgi:3-hydroxyisobutyrate dehydrogenase-like beta-hydroxyacid dehydrogenase